MTEIAAPAPSVRFGSLEIAYDETVLEPRDWTRKQSLWAAELARTAPAGAILELCAGAGQIGLLAAERSGRSLVAVDLNPTACSYAVLNARAAGLADRVEVRNSALESACAPGETYPVIIADPPWVPAAETARFPEDPLLAIDGGDDGLDVARACVDVIAAHLAPDGFAVLQVGTPAQVDLLGPHLAPALRVTELRQEGERGVLALVVRAD